MIIIYRSDSHSDNLTLFLEEFYNLTEYIHMNFKHFIICGDLNVHFNKSADQSTIKFCDVLNTFSLSQSVHDPTHRLGNTLDLVMHDPENVNVCNVTVDSSDSTEGISDHFVVHFDVCGERIRRYHIATLKVLYIPIFSGI